MTMFGIRSVKLQLLALLLLLDLVPLSRAFSRTSRTCLGQRRRENHCANPIGIGSWKTLTPTTRGGTITLGRTQTALYDNADPKKNNQTGNAVNENKKNKNKNIKNESASLFQLDPTLLVPDLLGVAVACELLGLLDAVNEPSFLQNGGWLQSAGGVPSTLPLLVSRFSINSVFWIASCFGISIFATGNDNDSMISNTEDTSNAMDSGQSAVGYALRIGAVFCIVRIVLALVVALATAGATGWDSTTATTEALLGVLRECYVVVLVTAATRYVVQALYYR